MAEVAPEPCGAACEVRGQERKRKWLYKEAAEIKCRERDASISSRQIRGDWHWQLQTRRQLIYL